MREKRWSVYTGDCVEGLGKFAGRADLIFADPPYNIGVDYGGGAGADSLPYAAYHGWCYEWLEACVGALSDHGSLWLLINDENAAKMASRLKRFKLHRRAWVIWFETFGVCNSAARNFSRSHRHLFYCVKDPKNFTWNPECVMVPSDRQLKYNDKRANPAGKPMNDTWLDIPRLAGTHKERIKGFPTQLPLRLLERIIALTSKKDDLVVDPFAGSGTAGAACLKLGRRFIGIEKSPRFANLARARLAKLDTLTE